MSAGLAVTDLTVRFGDAPPAVDGVSFQVGPGERVGLIGESGSGKSVTALACLGLLAPGADADGEITLGGHSLLRRDRGPQWLPDKDFSRLRGSELTMVFQEPMTALDPTMRVGRQVAEVVQLHASTANRASGAPRQRVLAMLDAVGLPGPERIADSFPHQLSGGQRQRIVLAMALINRPGLVICDEPTTALDVTVQARVLNVLDTQLDEVGAGCLFISHDLAVVGSICDRILVMQGGRLVEEGSVDDIFDRPRHPYTRGLLATARLDLVEPGSRLPTVQDFLERDAGHDARQAEERGQDHG